MRAEHSWSLLDPRPVLLYVKHIDDYVVYWNGVVMPHNMALCMTMEYLGIFPTPEMKMALEKTYHRLYYSNTFETRVWDSRVENGMLYPYLKRIMAEHIKKQVEGRDPREILSWFDLSRSRRERA
jgi:hypothetical protein